METKFLCIQYPDIQLNATDGPKLRGYFGSKYSNELMHHHTSNGYVNSYPLIQYKILNHIPTILGIGDGVDALLNINETEINIDGKIHQIYQTSRTFSTQSIGISDSMLEYNFITPWLALNPENWKRYRSLGTEKEKKTMLQGIFINNIISFCKAIHYQIPDKIVVYLNVEEVQIRFNYNDMLGFSGCFATNFILPNYIGLGKSSSHGFGCILKC